MVHMEGFLPPQSRGSRGRPLSHRTSIAKAFLARMIFQISTTTALRERLMMDRTLRSLCGWSRESTFSQVFQEFSESELPIRIHEALIRSCYENEVVGHISRDSTAIEAREAAVKRRRTRRKKKLRKLPHAGKTARDGGSQRDGGCKRNVQGGGSPGGLEDSYGCSERGHSDQLYRNLRLRAYSQVAIPLAEMTADRVLAVLYALMDSVYDAKQIHVHTGELGQVSITDSHPQRNGKAARDQENRARRAAGVTPPERIRYRERSTVERAFARLKDEFGFQNLRVRGYQKMMCHMMFGVLALTVDSPLRLAA